MADRGEMRSNCFILWGAEELGLVGSQAYVSSLTQEQRSHLQAMLNFDMVGVGDTGWMVIGESSLQAEAIRAAGDIGIEAQAGQLPPNASSDHASFINAGIPAVMFHRLEDPLLHTPQDVIDRVQPDLLEQAARMGIALLEALNANS
jgi:aminopeptidase YwaD